MATHKPSSSNSACTDAHLDNERPENSRPENIQTDSPTPMNQHARRAISVLAAGALVIAPIAEGADNRAAADPLDTVQSPAASQLLDAVKQASSAVQAESLAEKFPAQDVTPLDPAANSNPAAMENLPQGFDFQSHRGGRGQWTEESATAMKHSLEMGVTTLELDIVITADGVPMVWHDPEILAEKCSDTTPATAGDPQFPYVGKLVNDLTYQQIQTLNCDKKLENFPEQQPVPGNKMIRLDELFDIAAAYPDVHFNIETKIEGEKRGDSAEPQEFVDRIMDEIERAGVADRVMIQSFDWRSLPLVAEHNPNIPLVMLWDETTWKSGSPWTGAVDYDAVNGDIIEAAKQIGAQVLSPGHAVPYGRRPADADYHPVATPEFNSRAHEAGLAVVPWTVNDEDTMHEQIAAGVDGLISDYPTKLQEVLAARGITYASQRTESE